jgi:molybdopterin converting factor subunit 1
MITVLFFGQLAEIAGSSSLEIGDFEHTDNLKAALMDRFPLLAQRSFAIAVNKTIVQQNTVLPAGSVVAFLPPFSGG